MLLDDADADVGAWPRELDDALLDDVEVLLDEGEGDVAGDDDDEEVDADGVGCARYDICSDEVE